MFGRVPGGSGKRVTGLPPSGRGPHATSDWSSSGPVPDPNSTIQSAVSDRTSSVTSSEKRRSTPRQRSAASLAVPSVGPSTSRTLSDAQSNWSTPRRRCTACAVATCRIQPEDRPKNRSQPTHATAASRPTKPQAAPPCSTPASSSSGSAAPATAPRAAPARSTRAQRRLFTRSARYQATTRSAPSSTQRYSSSSRSAGSPQSPSGKGRPRRSSPCRGSSCCSPSSRGGPSGCISGWLTRALPM